MIIKFVPFPDAYFHKDAKLDCIGRLIKSEWGDVIGHVVNYEIKDDGVLEVTGEIYDGKLAVRWSDYSIPEDRVDATSEGSITVPRSWEGVVRRGW